MKDIAWWAGVRQKVDREALRRCKHRDVQLEGRDDVLYASASLPEGPAETSHKTLLTLLPYWDPYLTAHVDRSRYLDRRWKDRVIDRGGNSTNVILKDGMVVGVWDDSDGVLAYAGFESSPGRTSLRAASRPLVSILGDLKLVERAAAPSINEGGQNAFRSPLRDVASEASES